MTYFTHLDQYADRSALVDETGVETTYAALLSMADRLAGQIGRRCLVFIMSSNRPASVAAYVGCLRAGIVPVLINRNIDPDLLGGLLAAYQPAYLIFPNEASSLPTGVKPVHAEAGYVLLKTVWPGDYPLHDQLGLLMTTSGSTGSPKLVRQSYANIKSNTASIIEYLKIRPEDRAITTLPMHYTYGLSIINTHLSSGAGLILTDATLMEKRFWELLREQRVSTFGGVPYVYEVLKKLRFARMDLPSLRYITQAGGKLAPELVREFAGICQDKGLEMIIMYGQTEATARMSWLPWQYIFEKTGSIGVAIPGGCFWLADSQGQRIETPATTGELVYDGPNVTLGYAETWPDLAKGDERHGRLFTGDMAQVDEDGFYYIVGRKKRFLKLFGIRVNLDEVEGLLKKERLDCACAGQDDLLKVFVTCEDQQKPVEAYLTGHLGMNRAAFRIVLIERIPRNEAGKVLYAELP